MRWDDIRHLCATLQLATGASPREVMETLGHSQVTMTMNVFTYVVPRRQRDTADRMDALLQRAKSG
jgi:integrase